MTIQRQKYAYAFFSWDKSACECMYCCTHRFYTWPLVSVWTHLTVRAAEQLSRSYKLHIICVISLSAEILVERQHQLWHSRAMRKMFPSIIPWCCWRVNSSVNWQTQNQNHFRFCRNTFDIFCPPGIKIVRLCFICGVVQSFIVSCLFL